MDRAIPKQPQNSHFKKPNKAICRYSPKEKALKGFEPKFYAGCVRDAKDNLIYIPKTMSKRVGRLEVQFEEDLKIYAGDMRDT